MLLDTQICRKVERPILLLWDIFFFESFFFFSKVIPNDKEVRIKR
jgi:hypothetical protein